jgi:hypothetical protein
LVVPIVTNFANNSIASSKILGPICGLLYRDKNPTKLGTMALKTYLNPSIDPCPTLLHDGWVGIRWFLDQIIQKLKFLALTR